MFLDLLALWALALAPQSTTQACGDVETLAGLGDTSFEAFSFVQIGDPQIGYGSTWPAARRWKELGCELETTGADFGIVVGDLVQDRTWLERRLFRRGLASFSLPLTFVPGNHDVVDEDTLELYRDEFGPDHYAFIYKGCGFIGLNSELFEEALSEKHAAAQWDWLDGELEELSKKELRHLFLFLHRPPSGRSAWTAPLVERLRAHGVRYVLAGHVHDTRETEADDGSFTVFTVGGTAKVDDDRGYGYRIFDVAETGVEERYIEFDRPPSHWFLRQWTPRILDPSLPHWILTLIFAFTAWWCRKAKRASAHDPEDLDTPSSARLWGALACAYALLAANLQLDFDEVFAAVGRRGLYTLGLGGDRRMLQFLVLVLSAIAALTVILWLRKPLMATGRHGRLALVGLLFPLLSLFLHTLSLHQTEALLYYLGRSGLYVIEGAGALLSACMARSALRSG